MPWHSFNSICSNIIHQKWHLFIICFGSVLYWPWRKIKQKPHAWNIWEHNLVAFANMPIYLGNEEVVRPWLMFHDRQLCVEINIHKTISHYGSWFIWEISAKNYALCIHSFRLFERSPSPSFENSKLKYLGKSCNRRKLAHTHRRVH